jgi:hypothetical protein
MTWPIRLQPLRALDLVRFFALSLLFLPAAVHAVDYRRDFRPHVGYLNSVENEVDDASRDFTAVQIPAESIPLRDRIFNAQLNREFQDRYELLFGRTEQQRIYNSPSSYYIKYFGRQDVDAEIDIEKRKFGDYMVKRLAEYHVDNYFKSDPQLRVVWEAKERLSKVEVQVQGVRFDIKYSLTGNTLDINAIHPYVVTRLTLLMDPGQAGPAPVEETILTVSKDLARGIGASNTWKWKDGVMAWNLAKGLAPGMTGTLTYTHNTKAEGKTPRQTVYLSGITWAF